MFVTLKLMILISVTNGYVFADISQRSFPKDFLFGAASSAYQIEGAWNEDNKGENIWDHWVHNDPSKFKNQETGDVTCDSYHKYKEDVAIAAELGLTHYRFSISWSRLLPTGFNNGISVKGLLYYQNLIKECEKYNITPVVTMYHWDLPQTLQDLGGWVNPKIIDYFKDYAEILFKNFPSIKYWITINEPKQVCQGGYGKASKAPFISQSGEADYLCAYNVILAHATVYHLYQETFPKLGGKISIGLDAAWNIPASDSQEDKDAAERRLLFDLGIYAHPLLFGDWPSIVETRIKSRSEKENFIQSRLPTFTNDIQIKGTLDFLAFNFYDTKIVANDKEADFTSSSYNNDLRVITSVDPDWQVSISGNTIYPNGLRQMLKWLKLTYDNPIIFITENGIADDGSSLNDTNRINYLTEYLSAVLDSIYEDHVNVLGYTMWSLTDNFEWTEGYSQHYGFYSVNFSDTNKTRTPKESAKFYRKIIEDRTIPYSPSPTTSTISPTELTTQSKGSAILYSVYLTLTTVFLLVLKF